jgi:hypothetical protein
MSVGCKKIAVELTAVGGLTTGFNPMMLSCGMILGKILDGSCEGGSTESHQFTYTEAT